MPVLLNPFGFAPPAPLTYADEVLADSPLAYWRMNEASGTTLADSSGNSHSSTIAGTPGTWSLGQTGLITGADTCVLFSGGAASSTYGAWMDVTSAVTFEVWVKFTGISGFAGVMSRWQNVGGAAVGLLWVNPGGLLSFDLVVAGSQRHVQGAAASTGVRYHLVGVYDGAAVRLYVNGVQVDSTSVTGSIATGNSNINLANFAGVGTTAGYIDEAAFYGTALSSTRVAAHYTAGTT